MHDLEEYILYDLRSSHDSCLPDRRASIAGGATAGKEMIPDQLHPRTAHTARCKKEARSLWAVGKAHMVERRTKGTALMGAAWTRQLFFRRLKSPQRQVRPGR